MLGRRWPQDQTDLVPEHVQAWASLPLSSLLPQLGYTGACRNDSACQAANVTQMDVDCADAFAATPTCSEACNASLATVRCAG